MDKPRSAPKKPAEPDSPAKSLAELGLQIGEHRTIHRSTIKGAPYNPRRLGEAEKRKLRAGLKKHGLIGASLIINERTGNLVGGHQRLESLDALAKTANYDIAVTVIDVDENRE